MLCVRNTNIFIIIFLLVKPTIRENNVTLLQSRKNNVYDIMFNINLVMKYKKVVTSLLLCHERKLCHKIAAQPASGIISPLPDLLFEYT